MSIRIGLTGGIAAGKSTVAARMRELGALVIDYDGLAHEIVAPGGVALPRIAAVFGPDALLADGSLNRAWLAERVFGRDAAPERLDDIEHPLIYAEAARMERRNPGAKVIVHDVPLLTEVIRSIPFQFDHIVTVEAPEQMRIRRMVATRGMTERQAADRIRSQSSRAPGACRHRHRFHPPDPRHAGAGRWAVSPVGGSLNHSPVKRCEPGSAAKRT